MAEKKSGGNVLTKKLGPLPYWGWAAVGGGTFLIYRYLKARSAAAANTAASGTTGGTLIPNDIGLPAASTTTGQGSFNSIAAWTQAALDFGTTNGIGAGDALNQITAYLNGNCVSQAGYNFLSAVFANQSIGLPPAVYSQATLPTLSVCPSTAQTPTPATSSQTSTTNPSPAPAGPAIAAIPIFGGLSPALASQLASNGETVAASAWDPVENEFIVLTNKGGIYNVNPQGGPSGGAFFGSYLGLPAQDKASAPGQTRTFNQIIVNPDGSYTAVDTGGESYTFNQSTAQLEGV